MDFVLLLHAVLYYCIAIAGFFVAIPVAINRSRFYGICILYAEEEDFEDVQTFVSTRGSHVCEFSVQVGEIGMIIIGALLGAFYTYFTVWSKKDKDIGKRMCVLPFVVLNGILAVLSLVTACVLTSGINVFCNHVNKQTKSSVGCELLEDVDLPSGTSTGPFMTLARLSESASFIVFVLYSILTSIDLARWIRQRVRNHNGDVKI